MTPIVRRLLTVTALFSMCSYAALADVVGSATTIADIDIGGHIAGTTTFVDETRNVFGTPVNLGSAGTLTLTGQVTSGTPIPFTVRTVGSPCSLCSSTCQSCEPGCPLCLAGSGTASTDVSGRTLFVVRITDLAGTVVAGLSSNLSYTNEGSGTTTGTPGVTAVHFESTPYAFNAFQPVITQPGADQTVATSTTFLDSKTNAETPVAVDVTYASVNSPGTTTVTAVAAAPAVEAHFTTDIGLCSKTKKLGCSTDDDCPTGQTCTGYHGFAFDVATTATVSGPVKVCSHYPDNEKRPQGGNGFVDGTGRPGLPERSLRLVHEEGGGFVDVTLSGYPDALHNVVCGEVSSLAMSAAATSGRAVATVQGAFGLYVKTDMPGGGDFISDCWSEWALCPLGSTGGGNVKVPKARRGAPAPVPDSVMTCTSSNSKCKTTLNGAAACNFCVQVCVNVSDARLSCFPTDVREFLLTAPTEQGQDNDSLNAGRIIDGLKQLSTEQPGEIIGQKGATITLNPAVAAPRMCSGPINIVLPVNGVAKNVKLLASSSNGQGDADTLTLNCPK